MAYLRFAAVVLAGALLSVPIATVPADAQGVRGGGFGGGMGMGRGGFGGGMGAARGGFGGGMSAGRGGFGAAAGGMRPAGAAGGGVAGGAMRPGGFGGFVGSVTGNPSGLAAGRGPTALGARPPGGHWHNGHRHHAWHPGHQRHHHHGHWHGRRWPAYGYGLGLGAAGLGYGAYSYDGYYDQAAYAEEQQPEGEDPAVAACAQRFKSYDPRTRTYGGKGGRRIACP